MEFNVASPNCYPYPDFLDLNSQLSDDQKLIAESVREYIKKEAMPIIQKAYREE